MGDLSASEEVLLAATELSEEDTSKMFSEWDLTIEAWEQNPNRWGMRGYEEDHPDHKRVMMEVMGSNNLVNKGWLERPETNHYRVTSAGLAKAAEISSPRDTRKRSIHIYHDVADFAFHSVFEAHLEDRDEPKTWIDAEAFLQLQSHDPDELEKQLEHLRQAINRAKKFIEETDVDELKRGDRGPPISKERLNRLSSFIDLIEDRFERQLSAIREGGL